METDILKRNILNWGATLVGVADLEGLVPTKWDSLKTGVSIAVRLPDTVIDEIRTGPTLTYAHYYRATNQLLDSIAIRSMNLIQSSGYQALPVPASQIIDRDNLAGLISHKMAATRAGIGWIGKSALLVTPQFGPKVRLVSVLTDAPLKSSLPISESNCGKCVSCVRACPVGALKGVNWTSSSNREDIIEVAKCNGETKRNKETVGEQVCGICISVCPVGKETEA